MTECFENGEEDVFHRYWTKNSLGKPMLAEQHVVMYRDLVNNDLLAVTYEIYGIKLNHPVDTMGGTISVESVKGEGSTFVVELTDESQVQKQDMPAAKANLQGVNILMAEDVQASLDEGMNAHIAKPIVMDEVVKTIARHLN